MRFVVKSSRRVLFEGGVCANSEKQTLPLRRTVPYGMSSYRGPQRVRRSAAGGAVGRMGAEPPRCSCTAQSDLECHRFCSSR
ncbi:hypothetical protein Z043_115846 [Scleropages formosus]|uniref:Uncharacterized protein n=1 Tax=Scleropages formosus TaxID=113540 RepID=A0A0P7V0B7_SCLFO|nr:hypothetical protein Z043_115846 [Scleropages formosus]